VVSGDLIVVGRGEDTTTGGLGAAVAELSELVVHRRAVGRLRAEPALAARAARTPAHGGCRVRSRRGGPDRDLAGYGPARRPYEQREAS